MRTILPAPKPDPAQRLTLLVCAALAPWPIILLALAYLAR